MEQLDGFFRLLFRTRVILDMVIPPYFTAAGNDGRSIYSKTRMSGNSDGVTAAFRTTGTRKGEGNARKRTPGGNNTSARRGGGLRPASCSLSRRHELFDAPSRDGGGLPHTFSALTFRAVPSRERERERGGEGEREKESTVTWLFLLARRRLSSRRRCGKIHMP